MIDRCISICERSNFRLLNLLLFRLLERHTDFRTAVFGNYSSLIREIDREIEGGNAGSIIIICLRVGVRA